MEKRHISISVASIGASVLFLRVSHDFVGNCVEAVLSIVAKSSFNCPVANCTREMADQLKTRCLFST